MCEPELQIDTPVGAACFGHPHLHEASPAVIAEGDRGITVPHLSADGSVSRAAWHLDCWLHEIGADRLTP